MKLRLTKTDRLLTGTYLALHCCSDPPEPPDYSGAAKMSEETARRSLALQKEQLDWAKQEAARNREIVNRQLAITEPLQKAQAEEALRQQERYREIYEPIEEYAAEEAMQYASPQERQRQASEAMSQVAQTFDAQRENAQKRLESYGVDPSMTRSQALDVGIDIAEATAKAQSARSAENRVDDLGRSLRGEAINVGKGLPSQTAAAYGQALQAGQTGTQSALNQSQLAGQQMGTSPQYMQLAQSGALGTADILNTGYNNKLGAWNAKQAASPMNALGTIAGWGAKAYFGGMADGGMLPTAAEFFDGGIVAGGYPTSAGVRPLSYADGGLPARGALTGSGGPGMGGVTGPQRTAAGLRVLADGGGQTHAPGGDSSYQHSRANVRYPLGNSGGLITGLSDGSGIDDSIPAKVSAGEYIIPADVVHVKGREFFDKLLDKYHVPAAEQQASDTSPPNLGVPAVPMAADGGALPRQVPAHFGHARSPLPPASGGAGYMDGGTVSLTSGRGGNPDKRVHRRA